MLKIRLLLMFVLLFTLPALACSFLPQATDLDATATFIAREIFATMTVRAPTATYTATVTPTETVTPTPTITVTPTPTDTPLPTDTPEPTVPSEPAFGPITFAKDGSEGRPIDPSTKFPPGIYTVYACWDYGWMNPDLNISLYWYNNGKRYFSVSESWDTAENGSICRQVFWVEQRPRSGYLKDRTAGEKILPIGNWELKLFIGRELAQRGKFEIGD